MMREKCTNIMTMMLYRVSKEAKKIVIKKISKRFS